MIKCHLCGRLKMPEKCKYAPSSAGKKSENDIEFKEVVIIGNGPSAISLSFMLNGNLPYTNGLPSNDEFLDIRLREDEGKSLAHRDLEFLADGLEGRSNNPVSVLYDSLAHPDADLGIEKPSLLRWEKDLCSAVDHIVLGKGDPGGIWKSMEGEFLTVSLGSWMELPNLKLSEWSSIQEGERVSVSTVANYYEGYVKHMNLSDNFRSNVIVTSVKKSESKNFCYNNNKENSGIKNNKKNDEDNLSLIIEEYDETKEVFNDEYDEDYASFSSSSCTSSVSSFDLRGRKRRHRYESYDECLARDEENNYIMASCNSCNSWDPICNPSLFGYSCRLSFNSLCRKSRCCSYYNKPEMTLYEVSVYEISDGVEIPFKYYTRNIVLVTGSTDQPNKLSIPNEDRKFVLHSLRDLESTSMEPGSSLCIVGAGLSSADAILSALEQNLKIIHVFRRVTRDPNMIFNRLPSALYPEYHRVNRLMKGEEIHPDYIPIPNSFISQIDPDGIITVITEKQSQTMRINYLCLLIGSSPDLKFFNSFLDLGVNKNSPVNRNNPVDIDVYSHESVSHPGVYAMGPLIGDNFVRFIQGGALAITNSLFRKNKK